MIEVLAATGQSPSTTPVAIAIVIAIIGMLGGVIAALLTFFSSRRTTESASRVADTKTVVEGLSGLVDQLQEEVAKARDHAAETQVLLDHARADAEQLRRDLAERETELDNLRAEIAGLVAQLERLRGKQ